MTDHTEQRDREVERSGHRKMASPFSAKVVGVSFQPGYPDNLHQLNALANEGQGNEPATVVLKRNPANKFDANAIEVHVPALGDGPGFIGHLTRPIAARMAPGMDAGEQWVAGIESVLVDPDHMDRPGISIRCERKES